MGDDDTNGIGRFLTNDPEDVNPEDELERKERLPEDNDTPFSPPSGVQDRLGATAPSTDTNGDSHEGYDAGRDAEFGVDMPGQGSDEEPPRRVA